MITQIDISNFRSIKLQSIPLKKLNILYGPNGSGKSSVGYAPYVMRNFFVNPNQRIDSLFNLGFINLGGISDVKHLQQKYASPRIEITYNCNDFLFSIEDDKKNYVRMMLYLNQDLNQSNIRFKFDNVEERVELMFPYTLNTKKEILYKNERIIWNGLTFDSLSSNSSQSIYVIAWNLVYESIKCIELISVKRGFFSPIFSTEQATEESLFAMQIRDEGSSFEGKIDYYFKQLFDKTFRFVAIPGSTSFYLRTQNSKGFTTDLVNEGFGVNQTLYMLIKLLKKNTSLAFIEEPEIHLHPSAQRKLVDVFAEIVEKENKQIFLTTHSENIVSAVLTKIATGELNKNDVQFLMAHVENDETKITVQEVNDKGQIEGGLMSFMETELSYLKTLLGA